MTRPIVAYLAHPLRADPAGNATTVRAALRLLVPTLALMDPPVDIQAPHLDLAQQIQADVPEEDAAAMRLCLGRVARADLLLAVVYDGAPSPGVAAEMAHAEQCGVPVVRVDVATDPAWMWAPDRGRAVALAVLCALIASGRMSDGEGP